MKRRYNYWGIFLVLISAFGLFYTFSIFAQQNNLLGCILTFFIILVWGEGIGSSKLSWNVNTKDGGKK